MCELNCPVNCNPDCSGNCEFNFPEIIFIVGNGLSSNYSKLLKRPDPGGVSKIRKYECRTCRSRFLGHVAAVTEGKEGDAFDQTFGAFRNLVKELSKTAVFYLNYDLLMHKALNDATSDFCDMARGIQKIDSSLNGWKVSAFNLRRKEDWDSIDTNIFDSRKIHLFNLHGSLSWFLLGDSKEMVKVNIDSLRHGQGGEQTYWEQLEHDPNLTFPLVLYPNVTEKDIADEPFKLLHEIFERYLANTRKLCIIGYSFNDETINTRIKSEVFKRCSQGTDLEVVVVDTDGTHEFSDRLDWVFGNLGYNLIRQDASVALNNPEFKERFAPST